MRTSARMIIAVAVPAHTTTEGGQSGTERTLKEVQLTLQRMAIPVSYLFRIGAHLTEQCLESPRQSSELPAAVDLDPPPIRMELAALLGQLPAKVRVETHARSH